MKNYLVGAVRPSIKIWEPWVGKGDAPDPVAKAQVYNNMYQLSRRSARKFLAGDWTEIKHSAPVLDARMFQIAQWYMIKELWFSEPCNILVMGSDTLFIRPTEIFGQFQQMQMFNYSDPRHTAKIPHNFNDDIRYYPSDMDPKVWELGERHMADWFIDSESNWACGQHIHNHMLWSQGVPVEQMLKPQYAWQALGADTAQASTWNGLDIAHANVIHFHGSRGNEQRLSVMQQMAARHGIL
jgi:hypothetical protein